MTEISGHVEKARSQLKSERDSLVQKVKDETDEEMRKEGGAVAFELFAGCRSCQNYGGSMSQLPFGLIAHRAGTYHPVVGGRAARHVLALADPEQHVGRQQTADRVYAGEHLVTRDRGHQATPPATGR